MADWLDSSRNIGVLQTTVAEMITVKEHQRKLTASLSKLYDTC